jgi:hypothetical protein
MPKKKRADIGKLVDAQAKGKKVKNVTSDTRRSGSGEVDTRISKDPSGTYDL